MSNLNNSREQLENGWLLLKNQWQITAVSWNDEACRRFEREFMDEYEEIIQSTIRQMDNLAQVLSQASKQVE